MKEIKLYSYQKQCVDIINNLTPGAYLIVLATGLGKTVIFSHIKRQGRVLILSHREELVYQPRQYYDCSFGVEKAEKASNGEEIVSASVLSLINRLDRFKPDDFDIIITDEAHHAMAQSYRKIYDYFTPRLHLGFTATPNRADKNFLGDIYQTIVFERNIKWGIDNGYLSDIECRKVDVGYDLRNIHQYMGDFAEKELEEAVCQAKCNQAVAEVYNKYAVGPTLIFAATVNHANSIAEYIPEAEVITASTDNRAEILQRFRDGKLRCIVNCMVLTEGTDLPNIETIIMCRPTRNVSLYTQAVGRGTRLSPGKEKLHLIDCVGVSSMNICTAPVLFGISQELALRTKQDEGLLSDMESRIENAQKKIMFRKDFWEINSELVDIFTGNGRYDTHGINFIAMSNGDLVCPIGQRKSIRIAAEDMVGRTTLQIIDGQEIIDSKSNMRMQDALDAAHSKLSVEYLDFQKLWNKQYISAWGNDEATSRQADLIRKLYTKDERQELNLNLAELSKYQASVLIARRVADNDKPRRSA